MTRFLWPAVLSALITCGGAAEAALVSSSGTVSNIGSFSTFGSGDVYFILSVSAPGCAGGYWLRPADAGFKTLYAMLLSAKTSGFSVQVGAFDNEL